ncbi:MAG: acyl-CoA dehydrogenase family protein, partial [Planctomycetota bacterium]
LRLCGEAGVFEWFLPEELGGQGWSEEGVVRGYLALSEACLTTTFVITQRTGACRRIAGSENHTVRDRLLPDLIAGRSFATVGISHLTTSGRHLSAPRLAATPVDGGYRLDGQAPWVTGGPHADTIALGATVVDDGVATSDELLIALPTDLPGVSVPKPFDLVGVSASATGAVEFDGVYAPDELVLAGPVEKVMSLGRGTRTGGHETSTLAVGVASAALKFLGEQAARRADLVPPADSLMDELADVTDALMAAARGEPACSNESLRQRANSLVLRATQAALAAAKGAGYVAGHPVGRWCREALFFMVWSCPQPVMEANLCELAGIQ